MSDSLRSAIIRLAATRPDLRPHILPILKEARGDLMLGTVTSLADRGFILELKKNVRKPDNTWGETVEKTVVRLWPKIDGHMRDGATVVVKGTWDGVAFRASEIRVV